MTETRKPTKSRAKTGGAAAPRSRPRLHAATIAAALRRVSEICAALPDTERTLRADHAVYRVRGRVFAYFLNDHHGDGIVSVCVKSALGENLDRVRYDPRRYYLPAYIGPRGWFGLRLDRGRVDWREVAGILESSFRLCAPPAVLRKVPARRAG